MRAEIALYCKDKRVDIMWAYSADSTFDTRDAAATQSVAVGYWPTAAEVVDTDKILVSGKERLGRTRIEVWTVLAPTVSATPPGVTPVEYALRPQGLQDITEIYSDAVVGRDMVRGIISNRGSAGHALLHFHDSKSLYQIDWSQAPYVVSLVLDATQEPALANQYSLYTGGNHSTQGFVYAFSLPADFGITPWLVLKDTNRDGSIDWLGTMTFSQYSSEGLHDLSQYIEFGNL